MILIDAGNSSIKAQYWQGKNLQASFACRYRAGWSDVMVDWLASVAATSCALASVLDAHRQQLLDDLLTTRFGGNVTRLRSEADSCGVRNGYLQPQRLGVDRWLALLAAAEICAGDCLVIDAGSAITLDLLRADGQHLGGAILPGIHTSAEDFRRIFAHIDFKHAAIADSQQPGCSTEAAIQIDYAQDSLTWLAELVERWGLLLQPEAELILAGGDAAAVLGVLQRPGRIFPDLVFRGMRRQLNL